MKLTKIDTQSMVNISNEILSLVNEYDAEITNLFNKLVRMPYDTKEWVGNQAEKYAKLVSLEKKDYINFGNSIRTYAKKIRDDADEYAFEMSKNNSMEERNAFIKVS